MIAGRRLSRIAAGGVCALLLAGVGRDTSETAAARFHFADAADKALVALGHQVYAAHCGSCHGRALQGQPLWQLDDQFAGRRAPPHDDTGHTWRHSDDELFAKTSSGRFATQPAVAVSGMPAFAGILTEHQIVAVLAYIKSRWSIGLRAMQAMLNPDFAGTPPGIDRADWRLPPTCLAMRRTEFATIRPKLPASNEQSPPLPASE